MFLKQASLIINLNNEKLLIYDVCQPLQDRRWAGQPILLPNANAVVNVNPHTPKFVMCNRDIGIDIFYYIS